MARITPNIPDPQDYGVTPGVSARPTSVGGRGFQIVGADQRIPMPAEFETGRALQEFSATLAQFGKAMESTWAAADQEKVDQFLLEMEKEEDQLIKLEREGGLPAGWNPRTQRYYHQRRAEDFADKFVQEKLSDPEILASLADPDQKDNATIRQKVFDLKNEFFKDLPSSLTTSLEFSKTFEDLTANAVDKVIQEGVKQTGINRKKATAHKFRLSLKRVLRETMTGGVHDALQEMGYAPMLLDRREDQTVEEQEVAVLDEVLNGLIDDYQGSHALMPGELSATVFTAIADVTQELVDIEDDDALDRLIEAVEAAEFKGTSMPDREELLAQMRNEATKLDNRLDLGGDMRSKLNDTIFETEFWSATQQETWFKNGYDREQVKGAVQARLKEQGYDEETVAYVSMKLADSYDQRFSTLRSKKEREETKNQAENYERFSVEFTKRDPTQVNFTFGYAKALLEDAAAKGEITRSQQQRLETIAANSIRLDSHIKEARKKYEDSFEIVVSRPIAEFAQFLMDNKEADYLQYADEETVELIRRTSEEVADHIAHAERLFYDGLKEWANSNQIYDEDGNNKLAEYARDELLPKIERELADKTKELNEGINPIYNEVRGKTRVVSADLMPGPESIEFATDAPSLRLPSGIQTEGAPIVQFFKDFRDTTENLREAGEDQQFVIGTVPELLGREGLQDSVDILGVLGAEQTGPVSLSSEVRGLERNRLASWITFGGANAIKDGRVVRTISVKNGEIVVGIEAYDSNGKRITEKEVATRYRGGRTGGGPTGTEIIPLEDMPEKSAQVIRTHAFLARQISGFTSEEVLAEGMKIAGGMVNLTEEEKQKIFGNSLTLTLSPDEMTEVLEYLDNPAGKEPNTKAHQVYGFLKTNYPDSVGEMRFQDWVERQAAIFKNRRIDQQNLATPATTDQAPTPTGQMTAPTATQAASEPESEPATFNKDTLINQQFERFPDEYPNVINQDGSVSNVLLAYNETPDGSFVVFPTMAGGRKLTGPEIQNIIQEESGRYPRFKTAEDALAFSKWAHSRVNADGTIQDF